MPSFMRADSASPFRLDRPDDNPLQRRDLLFKLLPSPDGILYQGLLDVLQGVGGELEVVGNRRLPRTAGVGRILFLQSSGCGEESSLKCSAGP